MFKTLLFFVLMDIIITLDVVNAEPEAMARPTRPKVFTNLNELQKYLDLVRDYYSVSGKARYGKRGSDETLRSEDYREKFLINKMKILETEFEKLAKIENDKNILRQILMQLKPMSNQQNQYY